MFILAIPDHDYWLGSRKWNFECFHFRFSPRRLLHIFQIWRKWGWKILQSSLVELKKQEHFAEICFCSPKQLRVSPTTCSMGKLELSLLLVWLFWITFLSRLSFVSWRKKKGKGKAKGAKRAPRCQCVFTLFSPHIHCSAETVLTEIDWVCSYINYQANAHSWWVFIYLSVIFILRLSHLVRKPQSGSQYGNLANNIQFSP